MFHGIRWETHWPLAKIFDAIIGGITHEVDPGAAWRSATRHVRERLGQISRVAEIDAHERASEAAKTYPGVADRAQARRLATHAQDGTSLWNLPGYWTQRDGTPIAICDMGDSHLRMSISMLRRGNFHANRALRGSDALGFNYSPELHAMEEELKRRAASGHSVPETPANVAGERIRELEDQLREARMLERVKDKEIRELRGSLASKEEHLTRVQLEYHQSRQRQEEKVQAGVAEGLYELSCMSGAQFAAWRDRQRTGRGARKNYQRWRSLGLSPAEARKKAGIA